MILKLPLIGITSSNGRKTTNIYTPKAYIDAVQAAGGIALADPARDQTRSGDAAA